MIDDSINYDYIIRYLRDLLPKRQGQVGELEQFAKKYEVPISQPETMKLLEVLIRLGRVESVLEVGCAIGYSAINFCHAGAKKVDTVELSPDAARVARENFKQAGLSHCITLYEGDAKEILPTLEGQYDMIFMDAAKAQYQEFFPHCMRLLRVGGLLVSDNVLYKGMTATDELVQRRKITIVKRLRQYLTRISSMEELETSVLPIGDGVALSYKLKD